MEWVLIAAVLFFSATARKILGETLAGCFTIVSILILGAVVVWLLNSCS